MRLLPFLVLAMVVMQVGCATSVPPVEQSRAVATAPTAPAVAEVVEPAVAPPATEDDQLETTAGEFAVPTPLAATPPSRPDKIFLRQRLADLEGRAEQWRQLARDSEARTTDLSFSLPLAACLGQAEELIRDYGRLHEAPAGDLISSEAGDRPATADLYRRDIELLVGNCAGIHRAAAPTDDRAGKAAETTSANLETLLTQQAANGKEDEVVATFQRLRDFFPDHRPTPAVVEFYGLALLQTGHLAEAVEVLRELLPDSREMEGGLWERQRLVADLQLMTGQGAAARSRYANVVAAENAIRESSGWARNQLALLESIEAGSGTMLAYVELMRGFFTAREGDDYSRIIVQAEQLRQTYPDTELAANAGRLRATAEERLNRWLGDQLTRADELVAEKRFREAVTSLESLAAVSLPPDLRDMVRHTLDQVAMREADELEAQSQARQQALAARREEAVGLLDARLYDEAIIGFTSLLGTEHDAMAREKIKQGVEQAVAAKRRDAADLFVKAGRAQDRQRKGELLLASRQLLQEIVEKYPDADLIDKVQGNLDILDDQIRRFDPDLLRPAEGRTPEPERAAPAVDDSPALGE